MELFQSNIMTIDELKPIIESLIFVSEEPISVKQLAALLEGEPSKTLKRPAEQLVEEFNSRGGGLEVRQIAGGYRITTRPEFSEYVRRYLKSQPSARLSLAALKRSRSLHTSSRSRSLRFWRFGASLRHRR